MEAYLLSLQWENKIHKIYPVSYSNMFHVPLSAEPAALLRITRDEFQKK